MAKSKSLGWLMVSGPVFFTFLIQFDFTLIDNTRGVNV